MNEMQLPSLEFGGLVHRGNQVLGTVMLRTGNIEAAKGHLLASAATPTGAGLESFGPSMGLASELLNTGESETVVQYLTQCKTLWSVEGERTIESWIVAIRQGQKPDFGPNL